MSSENRDRLADTVQRLVAPETAQAGAEKFNAATLMQIAAVNPGALPERMPAPAPRASAGAVPDGWRHVKTGGLYQVLTPAHLEADESPVIVYRNMDDGKTWVRPASEFYDGRFVRQDASTPAPASQAAAEPEPESPATPADSTGAMAAAWFGTPALRAVEAVFGRAAGQSAADGGQQWITRQIRHDTPGYRAYLSARFPRGTGSPATFLLDGHRWRYEHTSFDDDGEFDVIARPQSAAGGGQSAEARDADTRRLDALERTRAEITPSRVRIPPSTDTVMTAELQRLFRYAKCDPACHACGKKILPGEVFKLHPHRPVRDWILIDEMLCANCGEPDLVLRDERETARRAAYRGGYSRPSKAPGDRNDAR